MLWHQASATDLLIITLRKSEALFSPSTRYRDLALGPALFHWESQSTTTAASTTESFVCLGFAIAESHDGERSMAWVNLCGGWSARSLRRGCQALA